MTSAYSEITHFHLFSGCGGGALGFQMAQARVGRTVARMRCLGGVDSNPRACRDFEQLVGVPASCLDLFDAEQYRDWHGKAPPPSWKPITPADILSAAGNEHPDIVFTSPPCKGFSGLLNKKSARSGKYQALNRLTVRSVWLLLEAFADDPPGLLLLENVPRIASRGRHLLDQIRALLENYGYAVAETTHDCGELGGLAQSRKRFLLVARHRAKVPPFLYEPPKQKLKSIGEVIGGLPMPDDPAAGPMHRLPRLTWKTWMRLALIPAGKDWRALQSLKIEHYQGLDGQETPGVLSRYGLQQIPSWHNSILGVRSWQETSGTVTGNARTSTGAFSVGDPRSPSTWGGKGKYLPTPWEEPAGTVIASSSTGNGAAAVCDPRCSAIGNYQAYRVRSWEESSGAVTAQSAAGGGGFSVADVRLPCDVNDTQGRRHNNVYRVQDWGETAGAVTAGGGPSSGGACISDPRSPWMSKNNAHTNIFMVAHWMRHGRTVTGATRPTAGALSISDPRVAAWQDGRKHFRTGGHYGVMSWDVASGTVTANSKIDRGRWAVACPTLPAPNDRPDPPPVIISLDGTWHRPLTTLELAALQGFPVLSGPDGYLKFDGKSHTGWREVIGNAVPPPAATAMASTMAQTLLLARGGSSFSLSHSDIWVENELDLDIAIALSIDLPRMH